MKAVRNAGAAIIVVGAIGAVAGLTHWYLKQRQQTTADKSKTSSDETTESTALVKIPVPTQPTTKSTATSKSATSSKKSAAQSPKTATKTSSSSKTTPTKKSSRKATPKKKKSATAKKSA